MKAGLIIVSLGWECQCRNAVRIDQKACLCNMQYLLQYLLVAKSREWDYNSTRLKYDPGMD
jgi:hypothetical protein